MSKNRRVDSVCVCVCKISYSISMLWNTMQPFIGELHMPTLSYP